MCRLLFLGRYVCALIGEFTGMFGECIVLKDPIKEGFANVIVCVVEERGKEKGLCKASVFFLIIFLFSQFKMST